jgi:hydrogenase maturation protease
VTGPILVIGYGSTLRGDDAIGPRAAEAVASWRIPGVTAIAVPQLTPELAEAIATARLVLFVDARAGSDGETAGVDIERVEPMTEVAAIGHASDPRTLLALALALFGARPRARLIAVDGVDFGLGEELSTRAARGLGQALVRIRSILDEESAADAGPGPKA